MANKNVNPLILLGIGIAGASYFSSKDNRKKAIDVYETFKQKVVDLWSGSNSRACDELIEKAGNPDPYDIGDTRMVSEGAMYSVDYYNEEEQQD